jgi:glycosyltransferase involved in cell wall biosynthesis
MGKLPKVIVVKPAYNTAYTLQRTYEEIPSEYRNHIILVDDASSDDTIKVAQNLGIRLIKHSINLGSGRYQKTFHIQPNRIMS